MLGVERRHGLAVDQQPVTPQDDGRINALPLANCGDQITQCRYRSSP